MKGVVLVVDDEAPNVELLKRMLGRFGDVRVDGFTDSAKARDALLATEYDLVLSDIVMPDPDGLALLRATRERWPDTEVVMLSGMLTLDRAVDALKLHAFDIVAKPIEVERLRSTVSHALERRALVQENRRMTAQLKQSNAELESAVEAATSALRGKVHDLDVLSSNYRAILDNMPSGCLILTGDGRLYQINDTAADILGFPSAASAAGAPLPDGERWTPLRAAVAEAAPSGEHRSEVQLPALAGGDAMGLRVAARRVRSGSGEEFTVVILDDVTQLNRMEQALRRSERLATVGGMAAGIGHEIKNPLGAIRGLGELLSMKIESVAALRKFSDNIMTEVDRLNRIVNDVTRFSREVTPVMQDVDLSKVLEDLANHTRAQPLKRRVVVDVKPLPSIPYDYAHLKQALENLIENALQATGDGGEITIAAAVEEGSVVITIRDDGEGIPPENMDKIFRAFFSTRKPKGPGLGLTIAEKVVQDHGGRLTLSSEPGRGTEARIVLPVPPAKG